MVSNYTMPSARTYRPHVVVEVRPEDVAPRSNMSSPSSPKAVHFSDREMIAGVSRPLTEAELCSLYHFEKHARACRQCRSPYDTILNGGRLCDTGRDYASDVAMHVYHRNGQVYSTRREHSRDIRVEVPHDYERLLALLRALDRRQRKPQRVVPIISYDTRRTSAPAVQAVEPDYEDYSNAYVKIHRSGGSHSPPQRRKSTTTARYSTIVVGDDDEYDLPHSSNKDEKRGSLYIEEPRRTEYRIEVRQPSDSSNSNSSSSSSSSSRRRHRDREARYYE